MNAATTVLSQLKDMSAQTPSAPMRGYQVRDDHAHVWVQDMEGVWLIHKNDIVARAPWTEGSRAFDGEPMCIYIRKGAAIYSLNRFEVNPQTLPVTLRNLMAERTPAAGSIGMAVESSVNSHAGGAASLASWNDVVHDAVSPIGPGVRPPHTTVCTYVDPYWGRVTSLDDSGD